MPHRDTHPGETRPGGRPTLVLHVGAMKTGTTYVQHLLQDNRAALDAAGWWVPEHKRVVQATRELLGLPGIAIGALGGGRSGGLAAAPKWAALLDDVRRESAAPGRRGAVMSMEFLSFMNTAGAALVRDSAAGLDLQIVLSARDAVHALPSQWQSLTRNGQDLSWPEFATQVRARDARPAPPGRVAFRRTQDVPRMLRVWSSVVLPERLALMTVPRGPDAPRDLLWSRWCALLEVDRTTTVATAFDNPQLGYGSCELMRLVNAAGLHRGAPRPYRKVVRRLTAECLLPLRGDQTRPPVDADTAAFAVALNARTLAVTRRTATLIGDPDDLPVRVADHPTSGLEGAATPPAPLPPEAEVLRSAAALHHGALALCDELGLEVPCELAGPLPERVGPAVDRVATVLGIAITGEVSHRP